MRTLMEGVTEYMEGMEVYLEIEQETQRETVLAFNECGYNGTKVDVGQLLSWLAVNRAESYLKYVTVEMLNKAVNCTE